MDDVPPVATRTRLSACFLAHPTLQHLGLQVDSVRKYCQYPAEFPQSVVCHSGFSVERVEDLARIAGDGIPAPNETGSSQTPSFRSAGGSNNNAWAIGAGPLTRSIGPANCWSSEPPLQIRSSKNASRASWR
jgi:hypothetical protein